jgi:hypothetical protein
LSCIDLLKSKIFGRITKGLDTRVAARGSQSKTIEKWQKMTLHLSDEDLIGVLDTLYRFRMLQQGDDDAVISCFGKSLGQNDSPMHLYYLNSNEAGEVEMLVEEIALIVDIFRKQESAKLNIPKFQRVYFKKWPTEIGEMWQTLVVCVWKKMSSFNHNMLENSPLMKNTWKKIDRIIAIFMATNNDNTVSSRDRNSVLTLFKVRH